MDQIIKHGVQMTASLDPASQKELRATLETIFSDAGKKLDFNTPQNRANIESLAKAFQSIFAKAGNTSIDFTKLMKMPSDQMFKELGTIAATQFWDAWNAVSGSGGMGGVVNGVQKQIDALTKQRSKLMSDYEKASKAYDRYDNAMGLRYMESDEFTPLHKQKDINKQAYDVMDHYDSSLEQLSKLEKGAKGYNVALLQAFESYEKLFKMKATIDLHDGPISDDVLSMYGDKQLKGLTAPFLQKYGKDMDIVGERATTHYQQQMAQISSELTKLDGQIRTIQQNNTGLINQSDADSTLLKLKQIEEAYNRIINKSNGAINKPKSKAIQSALDYAPGTLSLEKLSNGYNKSLSSNENWEIQYQWLTKFVREYEAYAKMPNANQKILEQYKPLYEQLEPMAENARNMLQNVLNMANNIPLVGMGASDSETSVDAAQNTANAEAKARAEAEAKAKADQESANAEAKAMIAAEAKAKADAEQAAYAEKERLAQEAAAKASLERASAQRHGGITTASENIQTILGDMNKFLSSNKDAKIIDYFTSIATGAHTMSNEVRSAIEETIGSIGSLQSISTGSNNYGGLIGDKSALILRKPLFNSDTQKWDTGKQYDNAKELQGRLSSANISDVNLGKIQELIRAEEYLVELQNRVSGAPISTIGEAIEGINPDVLNVTKASVESLIQAMRQLYNIGVEVDVESLGNVLYDGQNGKFGIVDMDVRKDGAKSSFASFDEEVGAFAQTIRGQVDDIADPKMAQAWSRFADMVDAANNALQQQKQIIHDVAGSQEQLNNTKSQEPKPVDDTKQTQNETNATVQQIQSYEQLCQVVERYNQLALQKGIKSPADADAFDDIATQLSGSVSEDRLLQWSPLDANTLAQQLGIEIPQAAQQAEGAINGVAEAQEKLNAVETQVSEQVDDTGKIQSENGAIDEQNSKLKENIGLKTQSDVSDGAAEVSEENAETQAIQQQNQALQENLDLKTKTNAQTGATAGAEAVQGGVVTDGGADVSAEASQLTNLQNVLASVTTAVAAKTQAFTAEEKEVARVVGAEIASLDTLEQKVLSIKGTLEGLLSNLKTGQTDVGAGLGNITVTVNKTDGADAEQKGSWALDTTVQSVRTSLDGVRTDLGNVISAIGNINTQPTSTGADVTLATEATLGSVKAVLDAINGKIVAGTKGGSGKQSEGKKESTSEKKTGTSSKKTKSKSSEGQDEADQLKKIASLEADIGKLRGKADNETNERVKQALEEEIRLRERLIQLIKDGSAMSEEDEARQKTDLSEKTKAARKAAADQQKTEKKTYEDRVKASRKEAGLTRAQSTMNSAGETLKNAALIDGASTEATAKFKQLDAALRQLSTTYTEISSKKGVVKEEDQQKLIAQRENVQQLQGAVARLVEEHQRLNGVNAQQIGTTSLGLDASSDAQQQAITRAVIAATNGRAAIKGFNADTNELTYSLKTGANQFTTFTAAIDRLNGSIMTVRGSTTQTLGVFATLGKKIKEYSYYFTGSMMIYRAIAWVREGITAIKDIDTALTELKKVTDATTESYEKFVDAAAKTADKVGSTIKEVISSTADWARLGSVLAITSISPII